jgi:DNA-binding response OmpR family regulator
MQNKTILAVDDDLQILKVLEQYLQESGASVLTASNGKAVLDILDTKKVDVILLDLVLPDTDGLDLMAKVRQKVNVPIIVLSGKGDAMDRVVGLELGADDYISKPFHLREVTARIKSVLRRTENRRAVGGEKNSAARVLRFEGWTMDTDKFELIGPDKKAVSLTTSEFQLLQTFLEAPNRVLTREQLFEHTRSNSYESFDRAIDIQVGRLRKKLCDNPQSPRLIKTIRGVGYMFVGDVKKAG